jgi:hypothetical protein
MCTLIPHLQGRTVMKPVSLLLSLLAAAAIAQPAQAAIFTGAQGAVTDYSEAGLVSFDLDVSDFSATRLNFVVEDGDLLLPYLNLNAIVRNLSGIGIERFTFGAQGITFAGQGSVAATFGTVGAVGYAPNAAAIRFASPELAEFHFGNPFGLANRANWLLDTRGLRAGDAFSITATVPEPSSLALLLASLVTLLGIAAQRRGN